MVRRDLLERVLAALVGAALGCIAVIAIVFSLFRHPLLLLIPACSAAFAFLRGDRAVAALTRGLELLP